MAVTRDSRHVRMTAQADAVTETFYLTGLWIVVTGATPGDAWKIVDQDSNIIAEGVVEAASQNIDCLGGLELRVDGITWTTKPAGTAFLLARFK